MENLPTKYLSRISVDDISGCWLWTGTQNKRGYGYLSGRKVKTPLAHRQVYGLLAGEIPPGLVLDHLCRTPICVNPAHLDPVTQQENMRRATLARTHCPAGHALCGDNVVRRRNRKGRECRTCKQAQNMKYKRRVRGTPRRTGKFSEGQLRRYSGKSN